MASSATAPANAAPAVGRTPVAPEVATRLDQYVDRAQTAASAFSAVYASEGQVVHRFARAIRTGRILVNAPTAVGALAGIYNSMTPTFSLGCGTWGGSVTTDNINYRNLLLNAATIAGLAGWERRLDT